MHKAMRVALDECRKPSHVSRADLQAKLAPILELGALAAKQAAELRSKLLAAELAPDHDAEATAGRVERLHQTANAIDKSAREFVEKGRALVRDFAQFERYAVDIEKELTGAEH